MIMKKINLQNYPITISSPEGEKTISFEVRKSIIELLFIPALKLNAMALMNQNKLAEKIKDAPEDFMLLEEEEYRTIQKSFTLFEGFDKHSVELVKRVLNAETVEVKPK